MAMTTPSHTPSEFASKMQEIFDKHGDAAHEYADELIVELLISLGYGSGARLFDEASKGCA